MTKESDLLTRVETALLGWLNDGKIYWAKDLLADVRAAKESAAAQPSLTDAEAIEVEQLAEVDAQPTPITNWHLSVFNGSGRYGNGDWVPAADAEFARQLERKLARCQAELAASQAELAALRHDIEQYVKTNAELASDLHEMMLGAGAERERCAKVCEDMAPRYHHRDMLDAAVAIRALPPGEPVAQPEPVAWLIERGQSCNQSPTIWWKGDDQDDHRNSYEFDWTEDANRANKYPTEGAAERVALKFFSRPSDSALSVVITEHMFVNMPRDAARQASGEGK